jgi:hypothetical protein
MLATCSVDSGRTTMKGSCSGTWACVDQLEPACASSSDGEVLTFSWPRMAVSSPHTACSAMALVACLNDAGRSLAGVVDFVVGGAGDSYQQSV